MSDDVSRRLQDGVTAATGAYAGCANCLDLRHGAGEQTDRERDNSQKDNDNDARDDEPLGPFRFIRFFLRTLDAQAMQVAVFGFYCHECRTCPIKLKLLANISSISQCRENFFTRRVPRRRDSAE